MSGTGGPLGETRRLNRDAVLAAAADLADAHGLARVTLGDLARELGVRTPSLYSHIRGTDDLKAGLAALALGELAERGDRALAGRSGRDALAGWANAYRDYAREHPGRFEAAGALDVPLTPALAAAGARVAEQATAILRAYPLAESERTHAVRLVSGAVRGFVQLEAGGAFGHRDPSSQESWVRLLDRLDHALSTWPG